MKITDKKLQNEILILADKRPGTAAQAIGLAEEIGISYKIINLDYGFLSFLPNIFLSSSLLRLTNDSKKKILANVWCSNCSHGVTITHFSGTVSGGGLLLVGKCAECHGDVARVLDGS